MTPEEKYISDKPGLRNNKKYMNIDMKCPRCGKFLKVPSINPIRFYLICQACGYLGVGAETCAE